MTTRPAGPRNVQRSPSPTPFNPFPETRPLNIRKTPKDTLLQLTPPNDPSPSPMSSLLPPQLSRSKVRPSTPKLKIPSATFTSAQSNSTSQGSGDSPTYSYYNTRPSTTVTHSLNTDNIDQSTIRPPLPAGSRSEPSEPLNDVTTLRKAVNDITNEEVRAPTYGDEKLTDDMFEELSRLGEGSGGAVYKVKDKRNCLIMARKTITTRETPTRQLLRELQFMKTTEHKNICRFHGAYMSPSSSEVKVLMEFCEGGSLEAVGKRIRDLGGRVGEGVAGRLAEGMFEGLAYLHSKKIVHRDIKPSNILLSREGVVKLCDFGVSGELVGSCADTFTGTSFYMAPERITGQSYTIRSDVWSAGLSLLELVQNRFPFPQDLGAIELMMYITRSDPPQLEDDEDVQWSDLMKNFIELALTVVDIERPSPKEMLAHPWIQENLKKEVPMARWIREVWGWPKPPRRVRAGYNHVRLTPIQSDVYGEHLPIPQAISPQLESPGVRRGRIPFHRFAPPYGQLNNKILRPAQPTQVLTPRIAQASYMGFSFPFRGQRHVNSTATR